MATSLNRYPSRRDARSKDDASEASFEVNKFGTASTGSSRTSSSGQLSMLSQRNTTSIDSSIQTFLKGHVLFKDLHDDDFIATLAALMHMRVYSDDSYVIRRGDVGRAMFFILRGEIEVVSNDGETVINVMREESFFGEIGVLFSVPRTASCRARGRCIILTLTKGSLQKAVQLHPEVAQTIQCIAEQRFASYMKQMESSMLVEFGQELKLGMTQNDLQKIPLFRDCSFGFLHMLSLRLKPLQYRQNDILIRKGEVASEMYFVVRGVAEVFSEDDGTSFAEFHPGAFFGEVGIFFHVKRTASVRCTSSQVAVFKLDKEDLDDLLKQYPEVRTTIQNEAKTRFQYNKEREKSKVGKQQQEETEIEVIRERMKAVPLFKDADIGLRHQLALMLTLRVYPPGASIVQKDEVGNSMYFVLDGIAEVVSEDGLTIYAELNPNSFFGEVALLFEVNRTATVRSRTQTTMFELSKDALTTVLEQNSSGKGGESEFVINMKARAKANFELFQERQKKVEEISTGAPVEEFGLEATANRLKQVSIFQNCDDGFLRQVALGTSVRQDQQNTIIVKKGDISREMFFIVRGAVEIVSEDGSTVYDSVKGGGFFGEVGLLRGIGRTASVRVASPICTIMVLTADALQNVFREYPESYQNIVVESDKRFRTIEARRLALSSPDQPKKLDAEAASAKSEEIWEAAAAQVRGSFEGNKTERAHYKDESQPKQHRAPKLSFDKLFRKIKKKPSSTDLTEYAKPALVLEATPRDSTGSVTTFASLEKESSASSIEKAPSRINRLLSSFRRNSKKGSNNRVAPGVIDSGPVIRKPSLETIKIETDEPRVSETSIVTSTAPGTTKTNIFPPKSGSPLQNLRGAALCGVVSYLHPLERLKMRLLCKRWNEALRDPMHWQYLDFFPIFSIATPKTFKTLWELSGEHLMSICLKSCWGIDDSALVLLARTCPNVESISLSNCWKFTEDGLGHLMHSLIHVREADLSYCGQISGICFVKHRWHNLRTLNLSYCKVIKLEHFETLLSRITDLVQLKIRRCLSMTDASIFSVVRYCRSLQLLDAADCDRFTDRSLKWLATSNKNLMYLDLTFCKRITNAGLYELSLGQQSFLRLDFSYCGNLTDAAVVFFTSGIRRLRYLSLRGCRKITNNVMKHLARFAVQLEVIDLTGCPLVTPTGNAILRSALPNVKVLVTPPPPNLRGRPRAKEMQLCEVFRSGPVDKMRPRSRTPDITVTAA